MSTATHIQQHPLHRSTSEPAEHSTTTYKPTYDIQNVVLFIKGQSVRGGRVDGLSAGSIVELDVFLVLQHDVRSTRDNEGSQTEQRAAIHRL